MSNSHGRIIEAELVYRLGEFALIHDGTTATLETPHGKFCLPASLLNAQAYPQTHPDTQTTLDVKKSWLGRYRQLCITSPQGEAKLTVPKQAFDMFVFAAANYSTRLNEIQEETIGDQNRVAEVAMELLHDQSAKLRDTHTATESKWNVEAKNAKVCVTLNTRGDIRIELVEGDTQTTTNTKREVMDAAREEKAENPYLELEDALHVKRKCALQLLASQIEHAHPRQR